MERPLPVSVLWIYAVEDAPLALELWARASVLEGQGAICNDRISGDRHTLVAKLRHGARQAAKLQCAEIILLLCSHAFLAGDAWERVLASIDPAQTRIIPIRVSAVTLPPALSALLTLPRDGAPLLGRAARAHALRDVIFSVGAIAALRSERVAPAASEVRRLRAAPSLRIDDVFPIEGTPSITFIEPPTFRELKSELCRMNIGLFVVGAPKAGKTTAVSVAMATMGIPRHDQIWWQGRRPPSLDEVARTLDGLFHATRDTWLFIEDAHHLPDQCYFDAVAGTMKALMDVPGRHAKITLIGAALFIPSVVRAVPELPGRVSFVEIGTDVGPRGSIRMATLLGRGQAAARVAFAHDAEFLSAAGGSCFLAQYLCNMACATAGIRVAPAHTVEIELGVAAVLAAIQPDLAARFLAPMCAFAAFDVDEAQPGGALLALLWMVAWHDDAAIEVDTAALHFPRFAAAFDRLSESGLQEWMRQQPGVQDALHYHADAHTLMLEDPRLRLYLRALDWPAFAAVSGHAHVRFHPADGPWWPPAAIEPSADARTVATAGTAPRCRILHLADLHLESTSQALAAYAELQADLAAQQVDGLEALVVTGDLVAFAATDTYDAARLLLEKIMSRFALTPRQVTLVAGNHDVSWEASANAYEPHRRTRYTGELVEGAHFDRGDGLIEVRDDGAYRARFRAFAELYRAIKGVPYPEAYDEQATLDELPESGLAILGLNSVWQVDHHFRDRVSIRRDALAKVLRKLGPARPGELRLAAVHHPLHDGSGTRIRDARLRQQLAAHGVQLVMHGHNHHANPGLRRDTRAAGRHRIDAIAAGAFGASSTVGPPGYPCAYNLLRVDGEQLMIVTRWRLPGYAWTEYAYSPEVCRIAGELEADALGVRRPDSDRDEDRSNQHGCTVPAHATGSGAGASLPPSASG